MAQTESYPFHILKVRTGFLIIQVSLRGVHGKSLIVLPLPAPESMVGVANWPATTSMEPGVGLRIFVNKPLPT